MARSLPDQLRDTLAYAPLGPRRPATRPVLARVRLDVLTRALRQLSRPPSLARLALFRKGQPG